MKVVIDANIIKTFYEESVLEIDVVGNEEVTSSTLCVVESLSPNDPCFLDEGGIIEHEWRNVVGREWFDGWISALLTAGHVQLIAVTKNKQIENPMVSAGFPKGRDIVYVRVADGIVKNGFDTNCFLITEDLDFHDPTKKKGNSQTRKKILANGNGKMCKLLRKFKINVVAVCNHC